MNEKGAPALGPDDVRDAAAWCADLLSPLADADWSHQAGSLEWNCRRTLEHIGYALDRYSVHLATPSPEPVPRVASDQPHLSIAELLVLMVRRAGVLASVVAAASPTDRSYHYCGMADPAGFVGMALVEILVHTYDIGRGLGPTWSAPAELCRPTLQRMFPWAPADADPWQALLWATGRGDLPGRDRAPADWAWQSAPLSEWDGTVKRLP